MQATITQWMLRISMGIDKQQLAKFRNGISEQVQDLSEPQTEYLYKISSTKPEFNKFNQHYYHTAKKSLHMRH